MAPHNIEALKALEKLGRLKKHAVPVATTVHVAMPAATVPVPHVHTLAVGATPDIKDSEMFPVITPASAGGAALKGLHAMRTALSPAVKAAISKRLLGGQDEKE